MPKNLLPILDLAPVTLLSNCTIEYEVIRAPPLNSGALTVIMAEPNLLGAIETTEGASGGPKGLCHFKVV